MKRFGWIAVLAVLATMTAGAAAAEPAVPKFNVDCDVGWGGCYRPLDWTPIDVNVAGGAKEPFEGTLVVSGEQADRASMTISHRFVLTPDMPLWIPLAGKVAGGSYECNVWVLDAAGRRVWEKSYGFWNAELGRASLIPVSGHEMLIGVAGRMEFGLRQLGKVAHSQIAADMPPGGSRSLANGGTGQLYVKDRPQRRLPWDWTGYESLDLLVLYDPDWTALAPEQVSAIVQWVTGGGRLLMVLGGHPLPAKHPLAQLLPMEVGAARQVSLPRTKLAEWGCAEATRDTVSAWPLEVCDAAGWKAQEFGTTTSLAAYGPVGFGRVGVLAFDPAILGVPRESGVAPFWIEVSKPLLNTRVLEAGPAPEDTDRYAYSRMDSDGDAGVNAILTHLLDIPEMRPISIIWVLALLLGLAVVIGPVDYFILKRRDRLPLTWITFTIYIVVFSVVAYYGVRALRAGSTQIRTVSVIDGVEGSPQAWGSCYSGIFASESDEYRLSGLGGGQWWSTLSPSYGPYDYNSNPLWQAGQRIACVQQDGANLPTVLPINIWSMQCLMTESAAPGVPIAARVQRDGDTLLATVTNLSDVAIKGGSIRTQGDRAVTFEAIPARGSLEVRGRLATLPPWHVNNHEYFGYGVRYGPDGSFQKEDGLTADAVYLARGSNRRTQAILDRLRDGAAVVCVEFDAIPKDAPKVFGLADRSFAAVHRQYARLVVLPVKGATHD
jgi:hypothetical protein